MPMWRKCLRIRLVNFVHVPPGLECESACSLGDPQERGLSLPGDQLAGG